MKEFKISIHCGQVNTFQVEKHESKEDAQAHYLTMLEDCEEGRYIAFGDVIINPALITFVVVEEVVTQVVEEPTVTLEA